MLYSARGVEYKQGELAWESVLALPTTMDLVVFGRIPGNTAHETAEHKLIPMDRCSDVEKFSWIKGAVAVLAPSLFEGYGMVPGEALACRTPVVVYDLPVLRWAYQELPVYVPWNKPEEFKKTVAQLVLAPPKISVEAQKSLLERRGLEAMRGQVDNLSYHTIKRKKVSAHCIVYWGFCPESVESIYPYVDELFIAYGPTQESKFTPPDGSLELVKALPDPDHKIKFMEKPLWKDKAEKRSWATRYMTGNYHLLLDGDEIWEGLGEWIFLGFPFSCPRWISYWHSLKHWIFDSPETPRRWGRRLEPYGSVCPHYRWSWWRASYFWYKHCTLADSKKHFLHVPDEEMAKKTPGCIIHHLGHCLPRETMKAKHDFYLLRDGDCPIRRIRKEVWHSWKGRVGDIRDGIVEESHWDVPEIVQRAFKRLHQK
jgi:hypothetical protein